MWNMYLTCRICGGRKVWGSLCAKSTSTVLLEGPITYLLYPAWSTPPGPPAPPELAQRISEMLAAVVCSLAAVPPVALRGLDAVACTEAAKAGAKCQTLGNSSLCVVTVIENS